MFLELKTESSFKHCYFEALKSRLALSSLQLEEIDSSLTDFNQSMQIYNQLQAISYIFNNHNEEPLSHMEFTNLLYELINKVTGGEITGFRTTEAIVSGSNVERSKPSMIRNDLWYLIDDYNYQIENCSSERSLYEIEAQFHIRFLHIHPYEDGNGRAARVLLAYNLCKNNLAPCIITKETKKLYCTLIEKGDYIGLADLFETLSKQEFNVMIAMYKELDKKGLILENKMSAEQLAEYETLKRG